MLRLKTIVWILVGFSLLLFTGCSAQGYFSSAGNALDNLSLDEFLGEQIPPRDYWPTDGWQRRTLEDPAGGALFEDLSAQIARNLPFVNSLLVVNGGYIVFEDYFNGQQPEDLQNQQSVAKSITSLLVGIAHDRGDIPSLDLTLGETLPEYFEDEQSAISPEITLRDALMMRSGLNYDPLNFAGEFESLDAYHVYVDGVLQEPLIASLLVVPQSADPGTTWQYNTGDTQLVSEMFQGLAGQSLTDYGDQFLFSPLGIKDTVWRQDDNGVTVGGAFLWLRAEDMAKIGYLMLNAGTWDGSQIVTKEWIQASIRTQGEGFNSDSQRVEPINRYGYQWWLWGPGSFGLPHGGFQAVGYGGQMILVLPDIDTVVVATSNSLVSAAASGAQQNALADFIDQYVIANMSD